jgi:hypothetical protein
VAARFTNRQEWLTNEKFYSRQQRVIGRQILKQKEMARGCKLSNKKQVSSCRQIPKLKGSG